MVAVRMMQVAINQIVHMVPMRYRFVTTCRPMLVTCVVTGATMLRSALVGIGRRDLDDMFIDMVALDVMEMPVVQIVDMAVMLDGCVSAIWAVDMRMMGMLGVGACSHENASSLCALSNLNSIVDRLGRQWRLALIVKSLPPLSRCWSKSNCNHDRPRPCPRTP